MSCETCKKTECKPEEGKGRSVPFAVHESAMARNERTVKRLVIALIAAIVLIFASNAIWLYAWMQYDYSSEESVVDVDANDGVANYIGNDGDIVNGADYGN
jgi:hypothetical protein